jgi:RND family efflux transporter MFP subunit
MSQEPLRDDQSKTIEENVKSASPKKRMILSVLVSLAVIAAGIAGATYITRSAPKAKKQPPEKVFPLVEIQVVTPEDRQVRIPATGTVIPAREVILRSRVSGEVVALNPEFVRGGYLKQGTEVLRIDPTDYKLALIQKQRAVSDAHYQLKLELGRQDVARREWELLNDGKPEDPQDLELALRKPHLEKAKADLAGAESELKKAELDLIRTSVFAPFNSIVRTKNVEIGSQVSLQDPLAELVGVDEYWVQISIPIDHLGWIFIPNQKSEKKSKVRIFHQNGHEWKGVVIKLLGDLGDQGRMARLLASVKDPLGLKNSRAVSRPLLIGEFVRVEIEGRSLSRVYRVDRIALRDDDTIWVVGDDSKLDIRNVEVIWKDAQSILLAEGLNPGDKLIVSDLAAPVSGMTVQIDTEKGM